MLALEVVIRVSRVTSPETAPARIRVVVGARPPLSSLFRAMQTLKGAGDVRDYVITRPSLETVFLKFARLQAAAQE